MSNLIMDYAAAAGERIWELLELRNVSQRDCLKESAATCGEQLESLTPSLMGGSRDGVSAGPAVLDSPGTVLIVLAHNEKVFTMRLLPALEQTLADVIENSLAYARDYMEAKGVADEWSIAVTTVAMEDLIKKHGRPPGQKDDELSEKHNAYILGWLFMPLPDEMKTDLIKDCDESIAIGLCPVIIGLLGNGEGGLRMIWPLLLPLAPYANTVIRRQQ